MYWLTKVLFILADTIAWLLMAFAMVTAVTFPFIGPIHARMIHQPLTTPTIIGTCISWICVAIGAFAITRRIYLGLPLILVPALLSAISGKFFFAVLFTAIALLVFGTPFVLVMIQVHSTARPNSAA